MPFVPAGAGLVLILTCCAPGRGGASLDSSAVGGATRGGTAIAGASPGGAASAGGTPGGTASAGAAAPGGAAITGAADPAAGAAQGGGGQIDPRLVPAGCIPLQPGNLNVLMSDRTSARSPELGDCTQGDASTRWYAGEAKPAQGPIQWNSSAQFLKWCVFTPSPGSYRVDVLMSAPPGTPVKVSSDSGSDITFSTSRDDDIFSNGTTLSWWDRIHVAQPLSLPGGRSTITIRLQANPAAGALLKSLELVSTADAASLDARVAALRSDTGWLSQAKYGLMLQWGAWSTPPPGQPSRSWPDVVTQFEVKAFGDMAESVGAAYVIWSPTWRQVRWPGPCAAIDEILPGRTIANRDLLGELASDLGARGIKLMLYFNEGVNDAEWWSHVYDPTDPDTKTKLFDTIERIVTEVGDRYGSQLAGWFFDDGLIWYPAPFERMTTAAKHGFAGRLVSYNSWDLPRFTDFQDVFMGEGYIGTTTQLSVGSDGIFRSGPWQGLLSHGMNVIDGPDWGVSIDHPTIAPPQFLPPAYPYAADLTARAVRYGTALSWDVNMYQLASESFPYGLAPASLTELKRIRTTVRGP